MNENYFLIELDIKKLSLNNILEIKDIAVNLYDCQGIEEFSMIESEVDDLLGERSYSGGDLPESVLDEVNLHNEQNSTTLKFYFSGEKAQINAERFSKELEKRDLRFHFQEEPWQDWNKTWRAHYSEIVVSDEMSVIPSWEKEKSATIKYPIYIYPGMGFGTGEHETTFLCLKLLYKYYKDINLDSCMDYGCGSAILGIAAKKLGAGHITLYDIDENALKNSQQNIDLNFEKEIGFELTLPSTNDFSKTYDLVFANILANVLIIEKNKIFNLLNKKGLLILSGILLNQEKEIRENYQSLNLEFVETVTKGDWVALVFKNES